MCQCALQLLVAAFPSRFVTHPSVPFGSGSISRLPQARLSRLKRQTGEPPEHTAEQPFREMALRRQKPVVASMLHQLSTRLHQPLLQALQKFPRLSCRSFDDLESQFGGFPLEIVHL